MIIKKLFYHLKRGKFTFIGKPIFISFLGMEIFFERIMDRISTHNFDSKNVNEKLTMLIKTFERPKELKRLIDSIRWFYPEVKIIIVDDSMFPSKTEGVQTIVLPYDSGVSAGRKQGLNAVRTKYFLLLDDDFIFYRKTDLEPIVKKLDSYSEIDILGGKVVNLPLYTSSKYKDSSLHPTNKNSLKSVGSIIGSMVVQDKVANFYIGRTQSVKLVGWDERIKRLDHADFFTRAKGVLLSVFTSEYKVLHAQTPFHKSYMDKRNDYKEDQKIIARKYYNNKC